MEFTEGQLNGLIVTHMQDGNYELSNMYQKMLKELKEKNRVGHTS